MFFFFSNKTTECGPSNSLYHMFNWVRWSKHCNSLHDSQTSWSNREHVQIHTNHYQTFYWTGTKIARTFDRCFDINFLPLLRDFSIILWKMCSTSIAVGSNSQSDKTITFFCFSALFWTWTRSYCSGRTNFQNNCKQTLTLMDKSCNNILMTGFT